MKRAPSISTIALLIIVFGCDPSPGSGLSVDVKAMVEEAKKGSPLFENANNVSASVRAPVSRAPGDPVKLALAYAAFKDYDLDSPDDTSAQGVDGSNIWVDLYMTFNTLQNLFPSGEAFSAPTAVEPSAALMAGAGETYTHHGSFEETEGDKSHKVSWAAEIAEPVTKVVEATVMSESDGAQTSRQALFLEHDADTGALLMDVNYFVDYSAASAMGEGFYSPKVWVSGNTLTNSFTVVASNYNWAAGSNTFQFSSIVGAGTNTGADEYMIFHEMKWSKTGDGAWTSSANAWYKVPAGAGPTELDAATGYDSLEDLVAGQEDPQDYASDLVGLDILSYEDLGVAIAGSQAFFGEALSFD